VAGTLFWGGIGGVIVCMCGVMALAMVSVLTRVCLPLAVSSVIASSDQRRTIRYVCAWFCQEAQSNTQGVAHRLRSNTLQEINERVTRKCVDAVARHENLPLTEPSSFFVMVCSFSRARLHQTLRH
jgi:hypothetical protein